MHKLEIMCKYNDFYDYDASNGCRRDSLLLLVLSKLLLLDRIGLRDLTTSPPP